MKTVLIIEDDHRWQDIYKGSLEGRVTFLSAFSLEEGEKMFSETADMALIVMDGCVDNEDHLDSLPLIKKIRQTYKGDMIAASGTSFNRDQMCAFGCNYNVPKREVQAMIQKLLNLN